MPRKIDHAAIMESRSEGHPVDYLSYLRWERARMVRPEDTDIDTLIAPVQETILALGRDELYGRRHYATLVRTPVGTDIEIHSTPYLAWAEERLRMSQMLVIDTATTGPHHRDGDRLLSLGVVEARMLGVIAFPREGGPPFIPQGHDRVEIVPTHDLPFDPEGRPSSAEAFAAHGLRDEDGDTFLPFHVHARTIHQLLALPSLKLLVAHNAPSAVGFLNAEFERCGLDPIFTSILDTRALSREIWPDEPAGLEAMAARLGVTAEGIGRGAPTALLLARCLSPLHRAVVAKMKADDAELEEESRRQAQAARKAAREKRAARARK